MWGGLFPGLVGTIFVLSGVFKPRESDTTKVVGIEADDREVEMATKTPVVDRSSPADTDIPHEMARWAIAAMLAGVALMGLFALVAAVVFLVELPAWVQAAGGVILALGTAGFAWLVASALAASRHDVAESRGSSRTTDINSRR